MSTIIDELIVQLKLDPKQFDEAQRAQIGKLRSFEREHERHSTKLKKNTDGLTQSFASLQGRLLAIAGLFLGGMGIEAFTGQIAKLTAQTGYLAQSLGLSTSELTKWQGAGATVGATANEMASAIENTKMNFKKMETGQKTGLQSFSYLTSQGGMGPQVRLHRGEDPTEFLLDVSRWMAAQQDKALAKLAVQQHLGYSQGMINLLGLGPDEVSKRLKEMERYKPSKEQIKNFQDLQEALAKSAASAEALGRAILSFLTPGLIKFLDTITDIVNSFRDKGVTGGAKAVDDAAGSGVGEAFGAVKRGGKWLWNKGKSALGFGSSEEAASPGQTGGGVPTNALPPPPPTGVPAPAATPHAEGALPRGAQARAALAKGAIADQLRQEGVPEAHINAASSLMTGQAIAESNLNPNLTHDGGTGFGIYGARLGRRSRMFAWLDRNGYPRNSLIGQSRYMAHEAMTDPAYRATRRALMTATPENMRFGTGIATRNFEAPLIDNSGYRYNAAMGVLPIGARMAVDRSNTTTNNNRSSNTSIGNMNIHVPPGSDGAGIARGVTQELQRYDNVMNSNQGLL